VQRVMVDGTRYQHPKTRKEIVCQRHPPLATL
jgi:hypothetical protein